MRLVDYLIPFGMSVGKIGCIPSMLPKESGSRRDLSIRALCAMFSRTTDDSFHKCSEGHMTRVLAWSIEGTCWSSQKWQSHQLEVLIAGARSRSLGCARSWGAC